MDFDEIDKLSNEDVLNMFENAEYLGLCMCYTNKQSSGCTLFAPSSRNNYRCCSSYKHNPSTCSYYCSIKGCGTENATFGGTSSSDCQNTGNYPCNQMF